MVEIAEAVARGVGLGSIYALLALGFVIIYKSTRVISFAQPAFMLAGVVLMTHLVEAIPFWYALALAALLTAVLALGVERVAVRPMIGRPAFVVAIITLGVDIAVRVVATGFIGNDVRHVRDPWGLSLIHLGPVAVQQRHLATFAVTAVLVLALVLFFRYTRMGLALRATSSDQEAALAQGMSVGTVFAVSWGLAGAFATVAGVFATAGSSMDGAMWHIALIALPVIILGGLDSLPGAVIAGLTVGVLQELVAKYQHLMPWLGDNVSAITPWLVMVIVLLIRPYGLFGTREVERV